MIPRIILHNSVSLDGSHVNFPVDMGAHYQVVSRIPHDVYLFGSVTALVGLEMSGEPLPEEHPADFFRPDRSPELPLWVIPDSGGKLFGKLHALRRFEYCRDILILTSEETPDDYLRYLDDRHHDYIQAGKEKVDYRQAFAILGKRFGVKTILADTGRTFGNLLIIRKMVSEISLLIHPVIIGAGNEGLFSGIPEPFNLKLTGYEKIGEGLVWIRYSLEIH